MITVDIEGVKVPIINIHQISMQRDNFSTTCIVEYVIHRAKVTVEVKDYFYAMTLFNNIRAAQENLQKLEKIEELLKALEYDLRELEKIKLEKLDAYGSLCQSRNDLLKD